MLDYTSRYCDQDFTENILRKMVHYIKYIRKHYIINIELCVIQFVKFG